MHYLLSTDYIDYLLGISLSSLILRVFMCLLCHCFSDSRLISDIDVYIRVSISIADLFVYILIHEVMSLLAVFISFTCLCLFCYVSIVRS